MTPDLPSIRPVRDSDGPALAALIADCFAAYPGCVFDMVEFPELQAPATTYHARGGQLWVAEGQDGAVIGSIAATPGEAAGTIELTKMYVAAGWRGGALARALVDRVVAFADAAGASRLVLWTDTRFERAHAFYRRLGFVQGEEVRELGDLSATEEYFFLREVRSSSAEAANPALPAPATAAPPPRPGDKTGEGDRP